MADVDAERRDPSMQLLRDLHEELERMSERLDQRWELVVELGTTMRAVKDEVAILRKNMDGPQGVLPRLKSLEDRATTPTVPVPSGKGGGSESGIYISPGWLSVVIAGVGFALTALWQLLEWFIDLFRTAGR